MRQMLELKKCFSFEKCSCAKFRVAMYHAWLMCHVLVIISLKEMLSPFTLT